MKTFIVELLDRREIAHETYSFIFSKPDDFLYTAGQYISLSIEKPEIAGPAGTMRELSLVSAPFEANLEVALRFRDTPAKKQFLRLQKGDKAFLQGSFGNFCLNKKNEHHIMLAGGIGIVPFLSLIKQSLITDKENQFWVFTSNRYLKDIPYRSELATLAAATKNLTLIATLTMESVPLHETGYISAHLINKYVPAAPQGTYYISGPGRFVAGMWDVLEEMHIAPSEIHGEEFTGYA